MSGWLALVLVAIPLVIGQLMALGEVVIVRSDLSIVRRVLWVAALLVVPMISLVAYVVLRPQRADAAHRALAPDHDEAAEAAVNAVERHARGEITDAEYDEIITPLTT